MVTALPSITAKIMAIVDQLLGWFVTVTDTGAESQSGCNISIYYANLTDCGQSLVDMLAVLVFQLVGLGGPLFSALGAYTFSAP